MKRKMLLIRDHSDESELAENFLNEHHVAHVTLFSTEREGSLPFLISPTSAYIFRGIGSIRLFVSINI